KKTMMLVAAKDKNNAARKFGVVEYTYPGTNHGGPGNDVSQDNNPDGNDEGEDNIVYLPSYIQLNPPLVPSVVPIPKVLLKSQQPRPTITKVFNAYYDESTEEPLKVLPSPLRKKNEKPNWKFFFKSSSPNKENVSARIRKIVGKTEDEDDDNEADKDEEDNNDDDKTIVDEKDDEKKEDVEELTKKRAKETTENEPAEAKEDTTNIGENEGDFDKNKREEFIPPRVLMFDAAPGQVVEEKEGTRLKRLRNSQCMPKNPTKELALYLPQWNKTRVYDSGLTTVKKKKKRATP
ncbi:1891_t:CDS:2, partial [Racocetra persica]